MPLNCVNYSLFIECNLLAITFFHCVIVQKKYVALMLLTAYRAAGLIMNMLKVNNEMDIKVMALIITKT